MSNINFNIIVAMNHKGTIGINNTLPWHLPKELAYYKQITMGHPMIMGRKTLESLPNGPLPKRPHIVLSRSTSKESTNLQNKAVFFTTSLQNALKKANEISEKTPFVIGGSEVFKEAMAHPGFNILYMSLIDNDIKGDVFFPYTFDALKQDPYKIEKVKEISIDTNNPFHTTCYKISKKNQ